MGPDSSPEEANFWGEMQVNLGIPNVTYMRRGFFPNYFGISCYRYRYP